MDNFQQNFLSSLAGGYQFGQQIKKQRDTNQLNQLAQTAYTAPPEQRDSLLGQMAGVDARAAQQQEQAFANTDERRNMTMVNMAKLLTSAPEQARAGLYQRMVPTLSGMGLSELPQEYNAQTAPIIDQAAQSIVQAYSGGNGGNVQSTYINRAGQRVAIMRDGSQQLLGDADARTQLRDQQGVAPSIVDLRTGAATPLQAAQAPPAAPSTSATVFRSPNGEVIDVSQVNEPGLREAIMRDPGQWGLAPDGGSAQLPDRVVGQAGGLTATRPDSSQTITPYQQAQLVRQDRADARAEQTALDARDARAQAAQARQAAAQQKAQQAQQAITTRQAALNNVRRGIERVRAALQAVGNTATGSGPIAQYATRYREAGQELETATGAMQNSMLALTRVPGIGSQSDLEAKIANMIYPSLERGESVNANTLRNLEQFYQDLAGTAKQSDNADRNEIQQAGAAPSPRGAASQEGAPRQIQSAEEYNALPSGALFLAPDGTQRRKR